MFGSETVVHGLKHQARCIASIRSDSERHWFVAGTVSLREENELVVLEYDQDTNTLAPLHTLHHAEEVWDIAGHPSNPALLFTCTRAGLDHSAALWRVDGLGDTESRVGLELQLRLPGSAKNTPRKVAWQPSGGADAQVALATEFGVQLFDLAHASAKPSASPGAQYSSSAGACGALHWSKLDPTQLATAASTHALMLDVRSMELAQELRNAHEGAVRDVHFNPNRPHCLLTAGDDCTTKCWDLRHASEPIKVVTGHSHWVYRARYNPFHDQLVLTGGADSQVGLWQLSSVSSVPLVELEEAGHGPVPDALVQMLDCHEDSVYGVAWSATDPWVFASLSYDGRVVVSQVPSTEKYKILL